MANILIIGAGLGGLTTALHLAEHHQVTVLAKRHLEESSTAWAQGGIVGVLDAKDSIDWHVDDTLNAGAGLVDEAVARLVSQKSASAIDWLIAQGVPFTTEQRESEHTHADQTPPAHESSATTQLHLTQEGGHRHRRIAHSADATGWAIHQALLARARAHRNITLREEWIALDLITDRHVENEANHPEQKRPQTTAVHRERISPSYPSQCYGAYVLDIRRGLIETLIADAVVIACGGVSKVYKYTTNPDTATGDGIAMAWRAGARVGNMEFIQFHPTCLYHPQDRTFLISEALRGEGAQLQLPNGHRFMHDYDERGELAPRDIVARAIDVEMKKHGLDHLWLDARHLGEPFLLSHFPTIHARCLSLGINIANERIPVVPAAHYTCGGVITDSLARTDLPRLYAVGESACTGLHGANRLASNSLLECVVFGRLAAEHINALPKRVTPRIRDWDESQVDDADEQVVIAHNWDELRALMGNYVGIARTTRRLQRALDRIGLLRKEVHDYYANFKVSRDLIELRNLLECSDLIVRSALSRHESRGLHYNRDYPEPHPVAYPTILTPNPRV